MPDDSNDHINMPYNDFLELGVEGGFIAVFLWLLFLITFFRHAYKWKDDSYNLLSLIISFIVIQLTNFGFQAIPAMVLFMLYCAVTTIPHRGNSSYNNQVHNLSKSRYATLYLKRFAALIAVIVCLIFTITTFNLMGAFYDNWMVTKIPESRVTLNTYSNLNKRLNGYPMYHEKFGDALMNSKQLQAAIQQYKTALKNTSNPDVFSKTGFCYQLLEQYDSSEHYYAIVQNMQPYKFHPKLSLLKLYLQKGDTLMVRSKANEIKNMRVKIRSQKVQEIKKYADSVLYLLNTNALAYSVYTKKNDNLFSNQKQ